MNEWAGRPLPGGEWAVLYIPSEPKASCAESVDLRYYRVQRGTRFHLPQAHCSPLVLLHKPWARPKLLCAPEDCFLCSWLRVSIYCVFLPLFCKPGCWQKVTAHTLVCGDGAGPAASRLGGDPGQVCGRSEHPSAGLSLCEQVLFWKTLPAGPAAFLSHAAFHKDFHFLLL